MQMTPVFKDATPREVRTMQFWIGSNIAVILFCASWLIYYFTVAGLSLPYLMAALLVGYFLADFSSGAVHWAMDTWFDERTMGRAIAITREHHTHPDHVYGFLENASFGSAPSAVVSGFAACCSACIFTISRTSRPARRSCGWRSGCTWFARRRITGSIITITPSTIAW